jgi:hypothetical protein
MAHINTVIHSFNLDGELRCVDIFRRPDGSFGFEEYRRDPEDNRGWFPVGFFADHRFGNATDALQEARRRIQWLASATSR